MTEQKFVLDANVFIGAFRKYYAPDLFPQFWDLLSDEPRLISVDRVRVELLKKSDWLHSWVQNIRRDMFVSTKSQIVSAEFAKLATWVRAEFKSNALHGFLRAADGWVVAYARAYNATVVTEESYKRNYRRKVQIPNLCEEFGVKWTNTYGMLRGLSVRMYLERRT